jgi:spore coat polysaccharide biosynthesis protein SpsF
MSFTAFTKKLKRFSHTRRSPSPFNVVAIVQARMGSTRLPGKVMMDIVGKPMLWHVVNRLKYSKLLKEIIVATTTNKRDDIIETFCKQHNISCYRGSEEDVLDRYYQAAKLYKADPIVRITADCPLIDPKIVDEVISIYLNNIKKVDVVTNLLIRSYPRGLDTEVISFNSLERIWKEANKEYQREHVSVYIYENLKIFRTKNVKRDSDLSYLRFTVDECKDLEFVREIYKWLCKNNNLFFLDEILQLLQEKPYLVEINKEVLQKSIKR